MDRLLFFKVQKSSLDLSKYWKGNLLFIFSNCMEQVAY